MNLAYDHIYASGVFHRSSSQPVMPLSPLYNPENGSLDSAARQFGWVSGNMLSPAKSLVPRSGAAVANMFADFDSKAAQNMPYLEKINYWLDNVPWLQLEHNVWVLDCYPGVATSTNSSEAIRSTRDHEDKVEYQCWQVTKLVTGQYHSDEQFAQPVSNCDSESESHLYDEYAQSDY